MNLHVHDVSPEMMKKAKARAVEQGKSLKEWVLGVLEKELVDEGGRVAEKHETIKVVAGGVDWPQEIPVKPSGRRDLLGG